MLARSRRKPGSPSRAQARRRRRAPDPSATVGAPGARTTKAASPATLSAALYFDSPARPNPAPAASQRSQIARRPAGLAKNSFASAQAAAARPNNRGPSGTIHVPAEAKKKGLTLRAKTAMTPARRAEQVGRQAIEDPAGRGEERDERQTRANPFAERARRRNGRSIGAKADGRNKRGSAPARSRAYSSRRFPARARSAKDEPRREKARQNGDRAAVDIAQSVATARPAPVTVVAALGGPRRGPGHEFVEGRPELAPQDVALDQDFVLRAVDDDNSSDRSNRVGEAFRRGCVDHPIGSGRDDQRRRLEPAAENSVRRSDSRGGTRHAPTRRSGRRDQDAERSWRRSAMRANRTGSEVKTFPS